MESAKLLNILFDIKNEEDNHKPTNAVKAIVDNYGQLRTQNNPAHSKALQDNLKLLEKFAESSLFNLYTPSDIKVLTEIKGTDYVGMNIYSVVSTIINSESFINEDSFNRLNEYQTKRNKFIQLSIQLKTNLESIGIEPHFHPELYEFGILLPEGKEFNSIPNLEKRIHRWNIILNHLNEIAGEKKEDAEISLVSNGCIELFIQNPEVTLTSIAIILERLATLYKRILEIRQLRLKMKTYEFPKNEVAAAEKHEKQNLDSGMDDIVNEIFENYSTPKLEDTRKNELTNALKKHVRYISKELDAGAKFEVRPPELEEPKILKEEETEGNRKALQKAQKEFELKTQKVELVKKAIETSKEFLAGAKEVFKLIQPEETYIEEKDE